MRGEVPTAPGERRARWRDLYERWLSPEGLLGIHLVVGFLVALLAGLAFNAIRDEVFEAPSTIALDAGAEAFVEQLRTPWLTTILRGVTVIGNSSSLAILTLIVVVVLTAVRSHRRLYMFLATMAGGGLLNVLLKTHFRRPRPPVLARLVDVTGYSFPSGHSMGSMLFFGGLAYVLYFSDAWPRWVRLASVVACLGLVLLVGGSRVYLGVHYLSDVIGGFAAGLFWLGVCLSGTEGWVRLRDWRRSRRVGSDVAATVDTGSKP